MMHTVLTFIPGRHYPTEEWFEDMQRAERRAMEQARNGYRAVVARWLDDGHLEVLLEWSKQH